MRFLRRLFQNETYEQMQARLIAETSTWITHCLRHPELATRIPVIQAGKGRFPPSLTRAFWEPLLQE